LATTRYLKKAEYFRGKDLWKIEMNLINVLEYFFSLTMIKGFLEQLFEAHSLTAFSTPKVQGCRGRGRPKKTWEQGVKCDIRKYGMQRVEPFDREQRVEPFDRDKWMSCCGSNRPTRASMEKRNL